MPNPKLVAALVGALSGVGLIVAGISMFYPPAAFIVAGVILLGIAAWVVDVE